MKRAWRAFVTWLQGFFCPLFAAVDLPESPIASNCAVFDPVFYPDDGVGDPVTRSSLEREAVKALSAGAETVHNDEREAAAAMQIRLQRRSEAPGTAVATVGPCVIAPSAFESTAATIGLLQKELGDLSIELDKITDERNDLANKIERQRQFVGDALNTILRQGTVIDNLTAASDRIFSTLETARATGSIPASVYGIDLAKYVVAAFLTAATPDGSKRRARVSRSATKRRRKRVRS